MWHEGRSPPIADFINGIGQNEKVSQRAFLDRCTPESGRGFDRGERQLRATTCREQTQQSECVEGDLLDHLVGASEDVGLERMLPPYTTRCTMVLHPAGREAERSELKRAFCSSLSDEHKARYKDIAPAAVDADAAGKYRRDLTKF